MWSIAIVIQRKALGRRGPGRGRNIQAEETEVVASKNTRKLYGAIDNREIN